MRVAAVQHGDGRIEFAVVHKGERISPSGRYLPSNPTRDIWYTSTPVTLAVDVEPEVVEVIVEKEPPTVTAPKTSQNLPIRVDAEVDGDIYYMAADTSQSGFRTYIAVVGETSDSLYSESTLAFYCDRDDPDGNVFVIAWASTEWTGAKMSMDDDYYAIATIGNVYSGKEYNMNVSNRDQAEIEDATAFFNEAKKSSGVTIDFPRYNGTVSAYFDFTGLFDTPVQPNLDKCGSY